MKFNYAGFVLPVLLVLVLSCSIIQDSDIKSAAEAANLKLTSIKIDQSTQTNGSSTATITPIVDNVVNISTTAGLINRYMEFNAPAFAATSKIKYRTSVADGARIWVYYFSTGKPSSVGIYKENLVNGKVKDSTFYEVYRFRYDGSGRVNKITTFLDPTVAPTTNDTLIYGLGNQVATILRRGPNPMQIVTVQYQGDMNVSSINIAPSTNPSSSIKNIFGGDNCFTCATASNSTLNFNQNSQQSTGSGGTSPLTISVNSLIGKPQTVLLENSLNLGYAPDTYYFHPLMLLFGTVPDGSPLLHIYMIDWWKLGTQIGSNGGSSSTPVDKVKFTFNYVKQ